MRKKLVGLYVPAAQMHFDLLVPTELKIYVLTKLLVNGVAEMSEGRFVPSRKSMLTLRDPDILLHPDRTLSQYNVSDGTQMILF